MSVYPLLDSLYNICLPYDFDGQLHALIKPRTDKNQTAKEKLKEIDKF